MTVDGWVACTVADVAAKTRNALVGGPFGSNLVSADYVSDGVPVIRGQNMGPDRWVAGEFVFVNSGKAKSLSANIAKPGDIIFTQRGNAVLTGGQVAIVPTAPYEAYLISQSQMKLTVDSDRADTLFLYYLFKSREHQEYLRLNAIQTGVPHTNLGILRRTPVLLPPLRGQQQIASILGTLDDKIELNRRMNETLEAMARTLFRSYFVDFDPVRRKAKRQALQGMDVETAALFPDTFEDSALGQIPKGWNVGTLGDIATNLRRGVEPAEVTDDTHYIGLEHMPRKSICLAEWGHAEDLASNKFQFEQGDILFGKLRPYFHKVGVAPTDGICSTDILVIRPSPPEWFALVLGHLSSDELVSHADASSTGTKMPRTSWADLARYTIAIPDLRLATAFTESVRPLVEAIQLNVIQARTLASVRDTLLPRLLSGETQARLDGAVAP